MKRLSRRTLQRLFLMFFMLVGLLMLRLPAHSRVLLKPKGEGAVPLRLKSLDADVEIERQFATTKTVMTFQNEVSDRIEADFIYTVPPHSVVTYFAYWYNQEKVVARVVEKERAAQIYSYITSRMRDPALIELIGKNTFRARIFPIMPNADLKIEIHTVEVLPSTPEGARYTFVLKPEEKGKGTLENLDVRVRVKRDAVLLGAGNNYALPTQTEDGAWTMHLAQKNYRPAQDLAVGLKWKPQPLRAQLLAAPSGGGDGFFALALTPSKNLNAMKFQISGVKTYDVLPARLPALQAGRQVVIVGRYRGSGAGKIALAGSGLSAGLLFGSASRLNNPATKLWAARQIELLSAGKKNKTRVIGLSQRFTLPSKWTSWLAIPEEERKRYQQEQAYADMEYYGRLIVHETVAGRGGGAPMRGYKQAYDRAAQLAGYGSDGNSKELFRQALSERANRAVLDSGSSRRRALREMQALSRVSGQPVEPFLKEVRVRKASRQLHAVAEMLAGEVRDGRARGSRARSLRSRMLALQKRVPTRGETRPLYDYLSEDIWSAANSLVQASKAATVDSAKVARLNRRLASLTRDTGVSSKQAIQQAFGRYNASALEELSVKLADEIHEGRENGEVAKALQARVEKLKAEGSDDYDRGWHMREAYAARAHIAADAIVREEKAQKPDPQKLASLEQELEYAAKGSGRGKGNFLGWHRDEYQAGWLAKKTSEEIKALYGRDYYMRQGDPLISIDAPADAQQVVAILPGGEVKQLVFDAVSQRWEARFDVPTYAAEGDYTIEVVIVDAAGKRRSVKLTYQVDMSAPRGEALAQRPGDGGKWRLEVRAGEDVTRVSALMPSGERVELRASATDKTRFLGYAEAAPAAEPTEGAASVVTYILTDRAHNRTQITVDMAK